MAEIIYAEQQRFRQWWLWLLILATSGIVGVLLINRGRNAIIDIFEFFLVVVGLPLFFAILRLRTRVSAEEVELEFAPIWTRAIPVDLIESAAATRYNPIRHYGGWGIRYSRRRGWAYNVSGNEGVLLTLTEGKPVLIGSRRSDELAAAINSVIAR